MSFVVKQHPHVEPLKQTDQPTFYFEDGLRKVKPYYSQAQPCFSDIRQRALATLLDVFKVDFRDRSAAYYEHVINEGAITLNGKQATCDSVVKNSDLIQNVAHRHEPPVIGDPVRIVTKDEERGFIVVEKPGSLPVHPTGRYRFNTLLEILRVDYGLNKLHTQNRLDRLTSGIMVIAINKNASQRLAAVFSEEGAVKKEYVCRVDGEFPEQEVRCEEPLFSVDRQIGLNIVHPGGRHACTYFSRLSYHSASNTSVVACRPVTGRQHQIRVHLQYLGHPITNDPIYNNVKAWGATRGKGGAVDKTLLSSETPEYREPNEASNLNTGYEMALTPELKKAILSLRKMRDTDDDNARAKDMLVRQREAALKGAAEPQATEGHQASQPAVEGETPDRARDEHGWYCPTCGVPLLPDPKPAQLCIWLHARKYSSEKGGWSFESDRLPSWATEEWLGWEQAMAQLEQ